MNATAPEPRAPPAAGAATPRNPFVLGVADAVFLATFAGLLAIRQRLLVDGDTGYHIRAGDLMLETHRVLTVDPFSLFTPAIPWTAHEWLAEVLMSALHRLAGLAGVTWLYAAVLAAFVHQTFGLLRAHARNLVVAVAFTVLTLGASLFHFMARPHAFSFLFFVVWMRILSAHERGAPARLLAWLPATMLLWVNLHAGATIGLVLLGLAWLSAFRGARRERFRPLGIALGAATVAAMVNPQGPAILLFPFKLQAMRSLMSNVLEFMPPTMATAPVFAGIVFLMFVLLARSALPLDRGEILRLAVFGFMAASSIRYTALFALVVAPMLARRTDVLVESLGAGQLPDFLRKRHETLQEMDTRSVGFLWPAAGLLAAAVATGGGYLQTGFDPATAPLDAIAYMKSHGVSGNGFHTDEFGDHIIYAAYPRYRVFIDGRLDMYGEEGFKNYRAVLELKPEGWAILERYDVRWILYPPDTTFARVLRTKPGWRVVYEDKVAALFVR